MLLTKGMRRTYPQHAHRFIFRLTYFIFQRQPAVDNASGMLIAALAVIRQLHGVSSAQDQACPQQGFQRLESATHRRLGGAHLHGGGRERSCLNDTHEGAHQLHSVYTL
ncbi:hypothetical protein D3C75_1063700 [compost metagenome]